MLEDACLLNDTLVLPSLFEVDARPAGPRDKPGARAPTPVRLVQWSAEEIFAVDDQGLGVFRVRGSAQAGDRLRDWSVIR
jgi:hypothetical protein